MDSMKQLYRCPNRCKTECKNCGLNVSFDPYHIGKVNILDLADAATVRIPEESAPVCGYTLLYVKKLNNNEKTTV